MLSKRRDTTFLKDLDRSKRKLETLQRVMVDLREKIYDAKDILADCQVQSRGKEEEEQVSKGCLKCFAPSDLPFQYRTGKQLREINEKIAETKENIRSYLGLSMLAQPNTADSYNDRWSCPDVYDHTQVVGLEEDTKKIKQWLLEANEELLAIGIIGMGVVGKTTTAKEVYNDAEIEQHFERKMWVSVTQTFKEEQIMRSMLKYLGDAGMGDDRGEPLRKINLYLQGKRYLLVMDDVWSSDFKWWDRIYDGLPKGNGSSVIITTRQREVARKMRVTKPRIHQPKFLSEENSWLLFCKVPFAATQGECLHSELLDVGKEIVEKCKGLPIAIKAVGGIMLCKYLAEWRRIADYFRNELNENDNSVMASLQLSYDELPPYLKSCFLCFSLYPEDCVITKEQLIH
ncbi:PREDICTED: disease resistance RPP13-like protein 4 [Nelumbo nucifera]|uniref:Disease resistance RPP13-like protein 4 n=1 Tax=Nelumbo nucifera TaxID=4432 RepID=A0A1U8AVT9_NELNU|nr:PREDICTED: disease resistance RPP13-like protein 4 [Nelumbo nucifera]